MDIRDQRSLPTVSIPFNLKRAEAGHEVEGLFLNGRWESLGYNSTTGCFDVRIWELILSLQKEEDIFLYLRMARPL